MTAALEGGEWSAVRPGRTLHPGKTRYPLYRRLVGLQGRSGRAENLVLTGIRSRTVQPVAQSLYRLSYQAHICICTHIYVCIYTHKHICIYIHIYTNSYVYNVHLLVCLISKSINDINFVFKTDGRMECMYVVGI